MPINYVATYYKTIIKNNSFIYIHEIGNSMFPLLNENMQLKILKKETYEKGDLVLYSNGSRLILHRIIEINTTACKVKGDNTLSSEVIRTTRILGYAAAYRLVGRREIRFVRNKISSSIIPNLSLKMDNQKSRMYRMLLHFCICFYAVVYKSVCVMKSRRVMKKRKDKKQNV